MAAPCKVWYSEQCMRPIMVAPYIYFEAPSICAQNCCSVHSLSSEHAPYILLCSEHKYQIMTVTCIHWCSKCTLCIRPIVVPCILWCSEHKRPIMTASCILECSEHIRPIMVAPCIIWCSEYMRPIMVVLCILECSEHISQIIVAPCILWCSEHRHPIMVAPCIHMYTDAPIIFVQ